MAYTANDAAPLLGLKPGSVRKYIERGKIAAVKHGRDWVITQDEIDRFNRERLGPGNNNGRKQTDATKKKLSDARKGTNNPFKGKTHTPEVRARMSARMAQQGKGADAVGWKGGRTIDAAGYTLLFMPEHPHAVTNYVYEHRLVMEQVLDRYLEPGEVVHHKSGDITDNRPENLEVMTMGEHSRYHRLHPELKTNRRR